MASIGESTDDHTSSCSLSPPKQFSDLPIEVRDNIWKEYYTGFNNGKRIYVLRGKPVGRSSRVLAFSTTIVDNATGNIITEERPVFPCKEAIGVYQWLWMYKPELLEARNTELDLTMRVIPFMSLPQIFTEPDPSNPFKHISTSRGPERVKLKPSIRKPPVDINWARDLLYLVRHLAMEIPTYSQLDSWYWMHGGQGKIEGSAGTVGRLLAPHNARVGEKRELETFRYVRSVERSVVMKHEADEQKDEYGFVTSAPRLFTHEWMMYRRSYLSIQLALGKSFKVLNVADYNKERAGVPPKVVGESPGSDRTPKISGGPLDEYARESPELAPDGPFNKIADKEPSEVSDISPTAACRGPDRVSDTALDRVSGSESRGRSSSGSSSKRIAIIKPNGALSIEYVIDEDTDMAPLLADGETNGNKE
ncbi:hypothetical protein GGR51DRAFT_568211 [Nemania sp. FL0031]|nr:hypothetical protein GGR51DRAFT_568211 [Nemania sp. FL0031]